MTNWLTEISKMEGAVLAADLEDVKTEMIKSPSPSFNWAMGGGVGRGKVMTVYGPESAGKTLKAMLLVIEAQRADPVCFCIWYDAEFSFSKTLFAKLGGDLKRLIIYQTNAVGQRYINAKGEERLGVFQHLVEVIQPRVQQGMPVAMVVVDSVKCLRGPKELEWTQKTDKNNGIGKVNMGNDAVVALSQGFKATIELFRLYKITCILIQQVNQEMDQDKVKYQHKLWSVPSGQVLKHFSDYMILVERVEKKDSKTFNEAMTNMGGSEIQTGHTIRCTVEKNRVDSPARKAEFFFTYNVGVTHVGEEIATLAEALQVLRHPLNPEGKPSIQMWTWDGGPIIRGRDAAVETIAKDKSVQDAIMKLVENVKPEVINASVAVTKQPTMLTDEPLVSD